jgi:hypothetical protein
MCCREGQSQASLPVQALLRAGQMSEAEAMNMRTVVPASVERDEVAGPFWRALQTLPQSAGKHWPQPLQSMACASRECLASRPTRTLPAGDRPC